jgi:phage tail-like protein
MKRNEIEALLPDVFQRAAQPGTPLFALLEVMATLHRPSEETLTTLDRYFDPYRTPERFIPYLAGWLDLQRLILARGEESLVFPPGTGRLRELIVAAAHLSRWRGTGRGLLRFLEVATGLAGFEIDETVPGPQGKPRAFHIQVTAPAESKAYRDLIERIIEMEKPAYVTYDLMFKEAPEV